MEIDAPDSAVAIWLEGDTIQVRFPDRQLIPIPTFEWPRLITILRARERTRHHDKMKVGTECSPTAWELEQEKVAAWGKALAATHEERTARALEAAERNRARLLRKDRKDQATKEMDALLMEAGL